MNHIPAHNPGVDAPGPPGPARPLRSPPEPLLTVPNLLSLSRLPLAAVLFWCIARGAWPGGLAVFLAAALTDWLDGWWARRYGPLTAVGRNLDPLTDKVLVCGAFVYLIPVPGSGVEPWMVAVVVGRELAVTGVRGMVEASGKAFGADWFGKLKMALQSAVLAGVLLTQWVRAGGSEVAGVLEPVQAVLLWAMLGATVGSLVQYLVKAYRLLR